MTSYHLHNDYEIYFLIEGKRKYTIDNKHYIIHENSLVFINRNVLHQTFAINEPQHKRFVLNFQKSCIPSEAYYLLQLLFENGPTILKVSLHERELFLELLKGLQNEYITDQLDSSLYVKSLLTQLLIASKRLCNQQSVPFPAAIGKSGTKSDMVSSMIKYIHEHYGRSLSLPKLSHKFHLSEHYLCHIFREVTGCTIIQYINVVRINEARRLLLETNIKIRDIVTKIGFSNHVHFCRVFKKEVGTSPTQFREDYI